MSGFRIQMSDITKMRILIAAILVIGGLFFGFFAWVFQTIRWWTILVVLVSVAWIAFSGWLSERCTKGLPKVMSTIVAIPAMIIVFALGLAQPFIIIVGTYLVVLVFTFGILGLFWACLSHICAWGFSPETICFLVLSSGSILCSSVYGITRWIVRRSPFRNWKEHRFESYREKLSIYLTQPGNIVFLMYAAYFVFLVITGYLQVQNDSYLISKEYDAAVLKAFLVFIAYTNMRTKWKDVELDAKEILSQTLKFFAWTGPEK